MVVSRAYIRRATAGPCKEGEFATWTGLRRSDRVFRRTEVPSDPVRRPRMKRTTLGMISGVMVLVLVGITSLSQAASPAGMKLYAFSSGGLTIAKSALQSGASSNPITGPFAFFGAKNPKGTFSFEPATTAKTTG